MSLHPQEKLQQAARFFQESEAYAPYRQWRQSAEHRLARLTQLNVRESCYFGRALTRFRLSLASMVANLKLVASK